MSTNTIETVKDYMELLIRSDELFDRGGTHVSPHSFLSEYGRYMTHGSQYPVHMMPIKECFNNAFIVASHEPDLIYCEGYAAGVFPVHHAWLIDDEGNVIDPTWRDAADCQYFGVPIDRHFHMLHVSANEGYASVFYPNGMLGKALQASRSTKEVFDKIVDKHAHATTRH